MHPRVLERRRLSAPFARVCAEGGMQGALRAFAGVTLLLSTRVAAAQAQTEGEPTDLEPIEVEIVGEKADAIQKIPGSASVVSAEEVERAGAEDAAELLRRVPGVHVRQDVGGGGRLDIGLRGLDPGRSRRVLVLEDGVPLANNPYAEPDLYYAPPVERWSSLEVIRGSGSILFGPQTIGGVINATTHRAPRRRVARLEAQGGERNFFQFLGRYGDAYGPARYLVQTLYRRGDGYRGLDFKSINLLGKVSFDTGPDGELSIKLGFHDEASTSDDVGLTREMFAEAPRRLTLAPHDRATMRRWDATLTHEHRFDDATLKTIAFAYTLRREWGRQAFDRFPQRGTEYERILGDASVEGGAIYFREESNILDRSYDVAGLEPRVDVRLTTGPVGHTITAGARVIGEGARYLQRRSADPDSRAGELTLDESRTTVAFASYLQDRLAFADDLLLVTPGLRFEHARYDYHVAREPTSDGGRDVDRRSDSEVATAIPGIGITAGTPDMHGFAGAHMGFAPPRAAGSIRANAPSIELEAERSMAYELGTRFRSARVWRAEATGYLLSFFNQILPGTGGALTELVAAGKTRHVGLETEASLALGRALAWPLLLDLTARYTLARAEYAGGANDGRRLPYAPSHLASAVLDVGHEIGLAAQAAYSFVGDQFADEDNTEEVDVTGRLGRIEAYHVLDVGVRYTERTTHLTASVRAKSVLDIPYVVSRRPEGIVVDGQRQILFALRLDYEASARRDAERDL